MTGGGPAIGSTCTVCQHERVKTIDQELQRGVISRRRIARQFAVDNTSLNRHFHNGHMVVPTSAPEEALPAAITIEEKLLWLIGKLEVAITSGQVRSDVIRELRMLYKEQREASPPPPLQATTYKDVGGWADYEQAVYEALMPFPDARQALSRALRDRMPQ